MAFGDAWGQDSKTYDGKEMRQHVAALTGGYTGVCAVGQYAVTQQASPNTTVQVAAGQIIIAATGAGLFGSYEVPNDAALTSPAFSPTGGGSRKDRLIVRVTAGVPALEIVQGVESGSPAEPAITGDNYEELALVTLPPGTTNITNAMITDRRRRLFSTQPGSVACTSTTRPLFPFDGMEIFETDTHRKLIYSQSAWVCITPQAAVVATSQSTSTTASYVDLTTVGPSVSVPTGTRALVTIGTYIFGNIAGDGGAMAFDVTGATTINATATLDTWSIGTLFPSVANIYLRSGETFLVSGLTPGINTFTAKYKAVVGGTPTFSDRNITAVGLP